MSNKVAIIIGHRSKSQGAYAPILNETEYQYMKKTAFHLSDIADIYERSNTPMVSEAHRIHRLVKRVNAKNYDLVISLHFNAFSNPLAHGATALYYATNKRTKAIGEEFTSLMAENFCVKKRALIPITSIYDRGGIVISKCTADAILLEPFFGTNKDDANAFKGEHQTYANNIRSLIEKYCNL